VRRRWRVTKVGWAIIGTLAACALLLTISTGAVRLLAGAVAGLLVLTLVGDGVAGRGGLTGSKREALMRDRFGDFDERGT
jgi:hypothetical protein